MNLKETIKPITHLKNNTAEVVREVSENDSMMIVTQNGEAKVVVIGVKQYDFWKKSIALLKILALGEDDIANDRTYSQKEAFERLDAIIEGASLDE